MTLYENQCSGVDDAGIAAIVLDVNLAVTNHSFEEVCTFFEFANLEFPETLFVRSRSLACGV